MTLLDRLRVIAPKSMAELERKAAQSDDPIASEFARGVLSDCAAKPAPVKRAQKKPEGFG